MRLFFCSVSTSQRRTHCLPQITATLANSFQSVQVSSFTLFENRGFRCCLIFFPVPLPYLQVLSICFRCLIPPSHSRSPVCLCKRIAGSMSDIHSKRHCFSSGFRVRYDTLLQLPTYLPYHSASAEQTHAERGGDLMKRFAYFFFSLFPLLGRGVVRLFWR